MPWSTPFDEPIGLHRGGQLVTLQQAADYIMKLPERTQQEPRWQVAVEHLINAAERRRLADVCADRDVACAQRRR